MKKLLSTSSIFRLSLFLSILVPTVSGLYSCREKPAQTEKSALPIRVARPEVRSILLTKQYPGYLKADKTIQLVARVSGTLLKRNYTPGVAVKAGQTLFLIDPSTYRQQVDEARANLKNAQANLNYAQATYERTKKAAQSNAVAQIQVIQTQAEYEQAAAQVRQMEAALQLAEITLGYCTIKAPYGGHVSLNTYDEGNYINAAENPVLATLYKDDTLYAYFNVSENQMLLRNNNEHSPQTDSLLNHATLQFPALKEADGKEENSIPKIGRLEYVSPNITLSTGTLQLRAELPNPTGELRDGMYVIVTLPYAREEQALLIPDASIGHDLSGPYLYTVGRGDTLSLRHIEIGQLVDDTMRLVTGGLSPDDRYVVHAQLKVRSGMKINPIH